jgi:hypothetical protein
MHRDTGHHRQYERYDEGIGCPVCGGETANRDHSREMVQPNDRMTKSGKDPLAKSRRRVATHQMMGEGRHTLNASTTGLNSSVGVVDTYAFLPARV